MLAAGNVFFRVEMFFSGGGYSSNVKLYPCIGVRRLAIISPKNLHHEILFDHFHAATCKSPVLEHLMFMDTPGILGVEKARENVILQPTEKV